MVVLGLIFLIGFSHKSSREVAQMRQTLFAKFTRYSSLFCIILLSVGTVYAKELTIASWNIEWLTSSPDSRFHQSERSKNDFASLSRYSDKLAPDILAFQEVNDKKAISNIVGKQYQIVLSERSGSTFDGYRFEDINQFTGFAVHKSLEFTRYDDLKLASSESTKLRFASYISVETSAGELHLLSVHLKAGCRGKYYNNRSCQLLSKEAKQIRHWIDERNASKQSYMVLGDFNHNLSYPQDWLFELLTEGAHPSPALVSAQTKAECQVRSNRNKNQLHSYRFLIDHIVASPNLSLSKPYQLRYQKSDVLKYQLSDHCPLVTTLSD